MRCGRRWEHADFSSFLIQARASGAKVIGFAKAGTDLQNCIKQAAEFGLTHGGPHGHAADAITDVVALGQKTCEGMVYTDSFYWDMATGPAPGREALEAKMNGMPPGLLHAADYAGVTHWLKAVKEAGTHGCRCGGGAR